MLAIRNGDEGAFETLMGRHVDALYRYALRLSNSRALADDLTQETWLTVWEKTSSFKPRKAALKTWLFRILYNKFIDTIRKQKFESDEPPPEAHGEDLSSRAENQRNQELLFREIGALPEQQRAAILLAYAQGFGNKDIAHILGTSVSATESLLGRARRTLKDKYEERSQTSD